MKKLLLLSLSLVILHNSASSQTIYPASTPNMVVTAPSQIAAVSPSKKGHKTTSLPGRWYSFVDSVFALDSPYVTNISFTQLPLWNDTTSIIGKMSGGFPVYTKNNYTSLGLSFLPFQWFNKCIVFPLDEMAVSIGNAYTIDSVIIMAKYGRNNTTPGKRAVMDSIRLGLVYGNGTSTADLPFFYFTGMSARYGVDTLDYLQLFHDSLNNRCMNSTLGSTPLSARYWSFALDSLDSAMTGTFRKVFPVSFNVPAGNAAALSVSFKSGDTAYHSTGTGDTIMRANGSLKFNYFAPLVAFNGISSAPLFPPYHGFSSYEPNFTSGYFKQEGIADTGWGGYYVPNWYLADDTGGPSKLQYPYILFHVTCATCSDLYAPCIGGIDNQPNLHSDFEVSPNPADEILNITYNLPASEPVAVALYDLNGRMIAEQKPGTGSSGLATINTARLHNGIYLMKLTSAAFSATRKVMIRH